MYESSNCTLYSLSTYDLSHTSFKSTSVQHVDPSDQAVKLDRKPQTLCDGEHARRNILSPKSPWECQFSAMVESVPGTFGRGCRLALNRSAASDARFNIKKASKNCTRVSASSSRYPSLSCALCSAKLLFSSRSEGVIAVLQALLAFLHFLVVLEVRLQLRSKQVDEFKST
jgi:hypothetical protein